MRAILINSSNLVQGYKNRYRYYFPTPWTAPREASVALQQISIYNSTFNIKPAYGNDMLRVTFGTQNYAWQIPVGYYSIGDLNNFIQAQCILNKLYAVSQYGQNVYFIELQENPTRYSCQLNLYPLAVSDAYSAPNGSNLVLAPSGTGHTPQVTISAGLGKLLGLPVQVLPANPAITPQQFVSQNFALSPIISPVDTYVVRCNLIQNPFQNPNDVLFQVPLTVPLGQLITQSVTSLAFQHIYPTTYSFIEISFSDQFFNQLENQDSAMTLTLVIDCPQ